jgi:ATP-dependent RNA helicase DDX5/DBP2
MFCTHFVLALAGGAGFAKSGADDSFGGLDYNAPPPDAYAKAGGLGITTNNNYAATGSGDEYRKKHEITVKAPHGMMVPDPQQNFSDGGWPASLMDAISRAGYTHPTPIQAQSWPIALQAGSGAAATFLALVFSDEC